MRRCRDACFASTCLCDRALKPLMNVPMLSKSVICLGSAIWDTIFKVDAIPSAGIKVLPTQAVQAASGMATSAAVTVARLGGKVELWGRLGADDAGQRFVREISEEGVDTDFLRGLPGVATPFSSIIVDAAGERAVIPYYDPAMPADASWLPLARVADSAAVLADVRWAEGATALLQEARRCGVPAVLDADTAPLRVLQALVPLATHLLFSEPALQIYQPGLAPEAALKALAATHDADVIGVTLGPEGALVWQRATDALLRVPAPAIIAVDTLNAGDVWHGTFVWAMLQGWPMDKVLRWANMAAAMKCEVFGGRAGAPSLPALAARVAAWDTGIAGTTFAV